MKATPIYGPPHLTNIRLEILSIRSGDRFSSYIRCDGLKGGNENVSLDMFELSRLNINPLYTTAVNS